MPKQSIATRHGLKISTAQIEETVKRVFPYESFFAGQFEAICFSVDKFLNSTADHIILEIPTGVGKSVIAYTIHKALSELVSFRMTTEVSTATITLQNQYMRDNINAFNGDFRLLKGVKNYPCAHGCGNYGTFDCKKACRSKICHIATDCDYKRAVRQYDANDLGIVNSSMQIVRSPEVVRSLAVLDECHKIPNKLIDLSEQELNMDMVKGLGKFKSTEMEYIAKVSKELLIALYAEYQSYPSGTLNAFQDGIVTINETLFSAVAGYLSELEEREKSDKYQHLLPIIDEMKNALNKFNDFSMFISQIANNSNAFILHTCEHSKFKYKGVDPADFAEPFLFCGAMKVLHMSATICGIDEYAKSLGIEEYEQFQITSPIPVESRQIYFAGVGSMSYKNKTTTTPKMAEAILDIINDHYAKGESGLIHTVSYSLAEDLKDILRARGLDNVGVYKNRAMAMDRFETARKFGTPCVVMSAGMEEGVDLKGDLARFQIICKIPFGFLGDPSIKWLCNRYPNRYQREAVLRVVQMAGRITRGVSDHGVTYVVDSDFGKLLAKGQEFFPKWFIDGLISC